MEKSINTYFFKNNEIINSENFSAEMVENGISLYEVIRVIDGIPLFIEEHLQRLTASASLINKKLWINPSEIEKLMKELVNINQVREGNIKIVFNYYKEDNNFLAYFIPHSYPSDEDYKNGVNTILFHAERNNPNAKVVNSSLRDSVNKKLKECNAYEAILVDENGYITEGSRSNIFMVKNHVVYTAPLKAVLPGITRKAIIDICVENHLAFEEKSIHYNELGKMDGLFITGTSPKVLPIRSVEDNSYPTIQQEMDIIRHCYDKMIADYIESK